MLVPAAPAPSGENKPKSRVRAANPTTEVVAQGTKIRFSAKRYRKPCAQAVRTLDRDKTSRRGPPQRARPDRAVVCAG